MPKIQRYRFLWWQLAHSNRFSELILLNVECWGNMKTNTVSNNHRKTETDAILCNVFASFKNFRALHHIDAMRCECLSACLPIYTHLFIQNFAFAWVDFAKHPRSTFLCWCSLVCYACKLDSDVSMFSFRFDCFARHGRCWFSVLIFSSLSLCVSVFYMSRFFSTVQPFSFTSACCCCPIPRLFLFFLFFCCCCLDFLSTIFISNRFQKQRENSNVC